MAAGADLLKELAARLADALAKRGFERESRRFEAHLTIGRVRDTDHDWGPAFASAPKLAAESDARFHVDRLQVVVSQLNPKGSIYTVRHGARLA
jgi:2'-5' RNA ligase